jgi:hypothetical protein
LWSEFPARRKRKVMAREFDIQELKWLISSIEGAIESGDRREAEDRLSELEWEIRHLENYVKTNEQAPVIEVAKGSVPASPAAVAKAVVGELRRQNLLPPPRGTSDEELLALSAKVRKIQQQVIDGQPQDAGNTPPESSAVELGHPDAGISESTLAEEHKIAPARLESYHRERDAQPQRKRFREREIAIREKILAWSSKGQAISTARQAKIVDWATDAVAELSESDFIDWAREEPDDATFEERVSSSVCCCKSIEVAQLWWRLMDMVDLADPEYLVPKAARTRICKTYEEQRASEEDYRFEVESAIREIADAKLRVIAQKVILRRFKGEIPFQPSPEPPTATAIDRPDPFMTKEQRTTARVKAQGTARVGELAKKLGTDRSRLNRWENHRLKDDKGTRARDEIEAELSKILATLK